MAWEGFGKGAASGSSIGAALGSFVPGIGTAIGAGIGGLLGGVTGGIFGKKKQTKNQKRQDQLVDQLLGSLKGQGPYSDLFNANEEDFNRTFAEPARQRFRSQTAPQIQQSYIQGGQQRSTGLEDTLARAGVDMDQLLNQHYLQYKQGRESNRLGAIGTILGQPDMGENQSTRSAALQGVGGYLANGGGQDIGKILGGLLGPSGGQNTQNSNTEIERPLSKGYETPNSSYRLATPIIA